MRDWGNSSDAALVIVQRDLLLNPENQTTKPRRHEEVRNQFGLFFASLCLCVFVVNSPSFAVNGYPLCALSGNGCQGVAHAIPIRFKTGKVGGLGVF
jgi:hypothetical protein